MQIKQSTKLKSNKEHLFVLSKFDGCFVGWITKDQNNLVEENKTIEQMTA